MYDVLLDPSLPPSGGRLGLVSAASGGEFVRAGPGPKEGSVYIHRWEKSERTTEGEAGVWGASCFSWNAAGRVEGVWEIQVHFRRLISHFSLFLIGVQMHACPEL